MPSNKKVGAERCATSLVESGEYGAKRERGRKREAEGKQSEDGNWRDRGRERARSSKGQRNRNKGECNRNARGSRAHMGKSQRGKMVPAQHKVTTRHVGYQFAQLFGRLARPI